MIAVHVVLIPAYEPDDRLARLVADLRSAAPDRPVLVVDDGSGPECAGEFAAAEAAGAELIAHERNRGKGAALRTGFAQIATRWPGACVVTADADGQHTPADVERVAARVEALNPGVAVAVGCGPRRAELGAGVTTWPDEGLAEARGAAGGGSEGAGTASIVLGVRAFDGDVPLRSRLGNAVTSTVFRAATRTAVRDTQTGLRGIPAACLPWLATVRGDRFEYEFRMLLQAQDAGVELVEEPIETVYTDGNSSSHFRPLVDSVRIYAPLLSFTASAFAAFLVDTAALMGLYAATSWLLPSVVGARLLSGSVNFVVNRRLVFRRGRDVPVRRAAWRYVCLAVLLLAANYGIITVLTDAGISLLAAKVLTDATLFVTSYAVQRAVVFAPPPHL